MYPKNLRLTRIKLGAGRNRRRGGECPCMGELRPEIIARRLTPAEAVRVHWALKDTPNILGYTVRELERLPFVLVAETGGEMAGVCFSRDLGQNWTEIAALCVLPQFQGRGIGKTLFDSAWDRAEARRRHLYVLSRSPQVVKWMQARGMEVSGKLRSAPLVVHGDMLRHMASGYRLRESIRKRRAIAACPPLVQGIKKARP